MFALHPHTQELVFQEINEVLDGQPPKQSDVAKLRSAFQIVHHFVTVRSQ